MQRASQAERSSASKTTQTRAASTNRSKPHIAWEQHDLATNGFYHRYLEAILEAYPQLTVTEERVAALVAGLLPSREIARILGITEHSVENYRSRIRKKIALPRDVGLTQHLQRVVIHRFTGK
jgi:DNA-binding CsgD family transcriptional regulator